jgi:hypothetical protein
MLRQAPHQLASKNSTWPVARRIDWPRSKPLIVVLRHDRNRRPDGQGDTKQKCFRHIQT